MTKYLQYYDKKTTVIIFISMLQNWHFGQTIIQKEPTIQKHLID